MPTKQPTDNRTCYHCKHWQKMPSINYGTCLMDHNRHYSGASELCWPRKFTPREETPATGGETKNDETK